MAAATLIYKEERCQQSPRNSRNTLQDWEGGRQLPPSKEAAGLPHTTRKDRWSIRHTSYRGAQDRDDEGPGDSN